MASLIRVLVVLGILGFTLSAPFDEVFPLALPSDDGIPVDDEQYEEILRPVLGDKDFNYKDLSVSLTDHHCSCSSGSSFSCQCCAKVNIHILHLRMCAGFAYNPNQQAAVRSVYKALIQLRNEEDESVQFRGFVTDERFDSAANRNITQRLVQETIQDNGGENCEFSVSMIKRSCKPLYVWENSQAGSAYLDLHESVQTWKALDFKVTLDGRKVYEKIVKVPVPTRFCHSINIEKHQLKLCVALTQISFKKGHTGGCFDVEVDYMFFKWKQRLGCLYRQEAVDEEEKRVGTLYFR